MAIKYGLTLISQTIWEDETPNNPAKERSGAQQQVLAKTAETTAPKEVKILCIVINLFFRV